MYIPKLLTTASTLLAATSGPSGVQPEATYDGGYGDHAPVKLRIGNGGAGQSGLVKEISDAFIRHKRSHGGDPFSVEWYKSDTTYTIKYLQSNTVDVGITYSEIAENISITQGIALEPAHYIFRDHFYFVGPHSNPANVNSDNDIVTIFSGLHASAEKGNATNPIRFLSRYDKSATNIKEAELFIKIGQVPWGYAYSTWYHQYVAYPVQALKAAMFLEEYTITDRGTYLTLEQEFREQVKVYKKGTDEDGDLLLNPARLLVSPRARDQDLAAEFAEYLTSDEGQEVITCFANKEGHLLYTGAPRGKRPVVKCSKKEGKLVWQGQDL